MLRTTLVALVFFFPCLTCAAGNADPLWERALSITHAAQTLIAGEVATNTEVFDKHNQSQEVTHKKVRLNGWKDGQAIWEVIWLTEAQKSGLANVKFPLNIAEHPDYALFNGEVERAEKIALDNRNCIVFLVKGKQKKLSFKAKVLIEEASGKPLKVDYDLEGIPMAKSMTYSINFAADEQGRWLPSDAIMNATISAIFTHFNIVSKQSFKQWTLRPVAASSGAAS
ncbi:hypothetical protein LPB67_03760 [Undibacterium sp. Jales W-56]|uniref:hypothetical protein n=1 Tax=Undibacterium sp. Jales W-56 TaxID=2897325 RepID=UPI0021D3C4F9|nr:hypothetical protein [Undibacterium sp. Jales W-56]MCU6432895.1 hypothetical protein [Undibacterium sp. Jales W-56]